MPCDSCPFNEGVTASAIQAQILGCLPSEFEIIQLQSTGRLWHCHSNDKIACQGLLETKPDAKGTPMTLTEWFDN